MTGGWSITQGIRTVDLPIPPRVMDDNSPPKIDEFGVDGIGTVLISRYNQARKIKLEGSIWVHGQNNADLETNYLAPLRAMSRLEVMIAGPDGQLAGNWLMGEPSFHREAEGSEVRYTYSIEFLQATSSVILGSSGGSTVAELEGDYTTYTLKSYSTPPVLSQSVHKIVVGNTFAYIVSNGSKFHILNLETGVLTQPNLVSNTSVDTYAGWTSILGKYIVVLKNNYITIYKDGSALTPIHVSETYSDGILAISPNGKYFAYSTDTTKTILVYEGS